MKKARWSWQRLEDRIAPASGLLREYWTGISGGTVAALTAHPNYPHLPAGADEVATAEAPANFADNFGQRLRGYLTPAVSGEYELFVAGDQSAELWLSTDSDPANVARVAFVPAATPPQQWNAAAEQRAVTRLVAGQSYYIEARHADSSGADHVAIGWRLTGAGAVSVIPGSVLTPWRPTVRLFADVSVTGEWTGVPALFSVTRDGDLGRALTVNYQTSGGAIGGIDYQALPGSVVITAGQRSAPIAVTPMDNPEVEGSERVAVTLTADDRYVLPPGTAARTAFAAIADNDGLPTPTVTLTNTAPANFSFFGSGASRSIIAVTGQPFTQASRVTTTTQPTNWYDVQLRSQAINAVAANDTLVLTFYARNAHPTKPSVTFYAVMERDSSPYTKSLASSQTLTGNAWQRFDLPFRTLEAYGTSPAAKVFFGLGFGDQIIEFGGVSLVNYGPTVDPISLNTANTNYQGRGGSETAWRDAARSRIEQYRQAPLTVQVRDASGRPVDAAVVHVTQTSHEFGFGTAVAADGINDTNPTNGPNYRAKLLQSFNAAVLENDLKWGGWQSNPTRAINAVDWLYANGITNVRGHNLVWPSWQYIPASPGNNYGGINYHSDPNKPDSQEEYEAHVAVDGAPAAANWLRQRVTTHIAQEAGHAQLVGKLKDWDVVNETYTNYTIQDILVAQLGGTRATYVNEWFAAANLADPAARLFLNDYPSLGGGAHLDNFLAELTAMQAVGAPLEGIGIQGHFGNGVPGIDAMYANLLRFSALSLPVEITEFDVDTTEEQVQADFLRDFTTLFFSYPQADAFLMWGFWAGRHWKPNAALWRTDWTMKPNGQQWLDLTQQEWHTDVTGATRAGDYVTRAYRGRYNISASFGGQLLNTTANVTGPGTTVALTLPFELPRVVATQIGDGSAQRSMVKSFQVSFNRIVTIDAGAFELTGAGGPVAVTVSTQVVAGATVATLTVPDGASLEDGLYTLRTRADRVHADNDPLQPLVQDAAVSFHRLFGDADGDNDVDTTDFGAFRAVFGGTSTIFDFDNDGDVDTSDFGAFRGRFGASV